MTQSQIHTLISLLRDQGIYFSTGLTDDDFIDLYEAFRVIFPEDLRDFLATAVPINPSFVDWRGALSKPKARKNLETKLNWPLEGFLFDVKQNQFWLDAWGEKPADFPSQREVVAAQIARQPQLIPIYSHRYIPNAPRDKGNPVFSVYQTDIIYYGNYLADYFAREFNLDLPLEMRKLGKPKIIDFWSDLVS